MSDLETIERRYTKLMQKGEYEAAGSFLKEFFVRARAVDDLEVASQIGSLFASALIAAGRDEQALGVFRLMLHDFPSDIYLRLRVATFLVTVLRRPSEALEMLGSVVDDLLGAEETRHAVLGVLGASHALLGRVSQAEKCLREMLESDLTKMDPSAFDFLLADSLVSLGQATRECEEYLSVVLGQAQRIGDAEVVARAEALLNRLSQLR